MASEKPFVSGDGSARGGFALAGVILAMALLMAFALAAWTASRSQVVVGGKALDWVRARLAAESAMRLTLEEVTGPSPVEPGAAVSDFRTGVLDERIWAASLIRPGLEVHGLITTASLRSGPQGVPVARAVWWLSPGARVRSFAASLEVGDLATSEIASAAALPTDDALGPAGEHAPCHGSGDLGTESLPLGGYGPIPPPPDWGEPPWRSLEALRLGLWDAERLGMVADRSIAGQTDVSGCPTCWSGLTLAEPGTEIVGTGAGLLVGTGDLILGESAAWHGMVLVAGDLVLGSAASVTGLVRVGGRAVLPAGARLLPSGCAAYRSLARAPGIHRPLRVGNPSSLGPLSPG